MFLNGWEATIRCTHRSMVDSSRAYCSENPTGRLYGVRKLRPGLCGSLPLWLTLESAQIHARHAGGGAHGADQTGAVIDPTMKLMWFHFIGYARIAHVGGARRQPDATTSLMLPSIMPVLVLTACVGRWQKKARTHVRASSFSSCSVTGRSASSSTGSCSCF